MCHKLCLIAASKNKIAHGGTLGGDGSQLPKNYWGLVPSDPRVVASYAHE